MWEVDSAQVGVDGNGWMSWYDGVEIGWMGDVGGYGDEEVWESGGGRRRWRWGWD